MCHSRHTGSRTCDDAQHRHRIFRGWRKGSGNSIEFFFSLTVFPLCNNRVKGYVHQVGPQVFACLPLLERLSVPRGSKNKAVYKTTWRQSPTQLATERAQVGAARPLLLLPTLGIPLHSWSLCPISQHYLHAALAV